MNINWCRHWNGILNPACRMNVPYLTFGTGPVKTWPCHREGGGSCIYQSFPTQEEATAHIQAMNESIASTLAIVNSIPNKTHGSMTCPNCRGTIDWSRSPRNGHLHAFCRKPGCFAVIQ